MPSKSKSKSKAKEPNPAAVDAWLATRPEPQRAALQRLREQLRAAAPEAVETIAYNVPMFYAGPTLLFGFNAFTHHLSLGIGGQTLAALKDELEGYDVMKDTVRFTPEKPLPAGLVKKLVKARLALHAAGKPW